MLVMMMIPTTQINWHWNKIYQLLWKLLKIFPSLLLVYSATEFCQSSLKCACVWCSFTLLTWDVRASPRPGTRITHFHERNRSAVIINVPLWPWTRDIFLHRTNIYLVTWILESHCRVTSETVVPSTWTELFSVVKCSFNSQCFY